jgi:hypothetical protein
VLAAALPASRELVQVGPAQIPGRVDFDDTLLRDLVGELPKTSLADGIAASIEMFSRQRDEGTLSEQSFIADAGLLRS